MYGAFLPGFFWPIIFISLGLSPCLMHLRILPRVCPHLLVKMDFSREAYGELDTTPLLTSKEIFSQKGLLDLTMRNIWSFIWVGLSLSYFSPVVVILEYRSAETNSSCSLWDPFISCIRFTMLCLDAVVQIYLLEFTDLSLNQLICFFSFSKHLVLSSSYF